ncbi:MAG TPA: hypothetical protein PKX05_01775 [bacterium]|nr:hypothetical protein [bacterium]
MKRKIFIVSLLSVVICNFLFAQDIDVKEAFFQKFASRYADVSAVSATLEINMSIADSVIKIPMSMWIKDNRIRLDASIPTVGKNESAQQIILLNNNIISVYNNLKNTIMTVDLDRLSNNSKKKPMNKKSLILTADTELLNKIKENVDVKETMKNDKKFYLLTMDFDTIINNLNIKKNKPMFFKKLVYRVDYETLIPVTLELYGDTDTPGIWINFIEIKTEDVSDSVFDIKFPDDVKKIDITDSIKGILTQ